MTVLCPKCRRAIRVPPDKEAVPNLKARCSGCGTGCLLGLAVFKKAPELGLD